MAGKIRKAVSFLVRRGKERRVGIADRRQIPFEAHGFIDALKDAGFQGKKRRAVKSTTLKDNKLDFTVTAQQRRNQKLVYQAQTDRREKFDSIVFPSKKAQKKK